LPWARSAARATEPSVLAGLGLPWRYWIGGWQIVVPAVLARQVVPGGQLGALASQWNSHTRETPGNTWNSRPHVGVDPAGPPVHGASSVVQVFVQRFRPCSTPTLTHTSPAAHCGERQDEKEGNGYPQRHEHAGSFPRNVPDAKKTAPPSALPAPTDAREESDGLPERCHRTATRLLCGISPTLLR
jgi:hypothetical protein